MASVVANRVKETVSSTGTGSIALSGAVTRFRAFAGTVPVGATFTYVIEVPSGAWETGTGTMGTDGKIVRALEDSSTGGLLNLAGEVGTTISLAPTAAVFSQITGDVATTKAAVAVLTGANPSAGVGAGSGTTSTSLSTVATGNPMPGLIMAIDAALPASQATLVVGKPGIQVDVNGNVLGLIEPVNGYQCGHGYGETLLAQGGPGGFPVFRSNTAGFNQSYDAITAPFAAAATLFSNAGAGCYVVFVLKQTAAGANALLQAWGTSGNVNIGGSATDGALHVEQNNGGAQGDEPSSAMTALNQEQILEAIFDPTKGTISVWRGGLLSYQTGAGPIGGIGALTRFEFLNDARADVSCILMGNVIPTVAQQNAVRAFLTTRYGITAAVSTPVTPTSGGAPTMLSNAQVYHQPSGPITKSQAQPFGCTLVNPNSNLQDISFGPNGTCKNRTQLFQQIYTRTANNIYAPQYYPNQGESHWEAPYRDYPEFLSDGVTPDPRNLHVVDPTKDYMSLICRTKMAGSFDGSRYEMGFIRLGEHVKPGRCTEICWWFPGGTFDPAGQLLSWPTFWGFNFYQLFGTQDIYGGQPSLELDFPDNFREDNSPLGTSYNFGYVIYGTYLQDANGNYYPDPSVYGNPDDLYLTSGPGVTYVNGRFQTPTANDPTLGWHYVMLDWRDSNTLLMLVDGQVIRKLHMSYPAMFGQGGVIMNGNAPPASLNGTPVPMSIYVGHQSQAAFNTNTLNALHANDDVANPLYVELRVRSIRVWESTTTADPVSSTPVNATFPAVQSGSVLGDLPPLSGASYVLNIDASKANPVSDRIGGNAVRMLGDADIPTDTVNGLTTMRVQTNGALSITGQAVARAQGLGQVMTFMVVQSRNPYFGPQSLMQFTQSYPESDQGINKITLLSSGFGSGGHLADFNNNGQNFGAYLQTPNNGPAVVSACGSYNVNHPELITLTKIIASDGTVVLGQGYLEQETAPAAGGGVPVSAIAGLTELLIGNSRQHYGPLAGGANVLLCQFVEITTPPGTAFLPADVAAIKAALTSKWSIPTSNTLTNSASSYVALPPTPPPAPPATAPNLATAPVAATLSGLNFAWANQAAATVSGGGSAPLVLASPGQNGNSLNALLTPIVPGTYTALFTPNYAAGQYPNGGILWGKQGGMALGHLFDLTLKSPSHLMIASTRPGYTNNDSQLGQAAVTAFGAQGSPFLMRIVVDGTNLTTAVAPAGVVAGGWTQISQNTLASLGTPDCIGPFINLSDGVAGNVTFAGFVHTAATDIQAAPPSFSAGGSLQVSATPATSPAAPVSGMVSTFDYTPATAGLALLTRGSSSDFQAGYAANAATNAAAMWEPRYTPEGNAPAGGSDIYSGNYSLNVDPEGPLGGTFNPFSIQGGALRIRAQKTADFSFAAGAVPNDPASNASYPWLTGLLSSKARFTQQGGYWEIDAQMPHGAGSWPAFWLIPTSEAHPPEIDVIEYCGQDPATTYRRNAISLGPVMHSSNVVASADLSQASHKYAVWITDTTIKYYLDGALVGTQDITSLPEFGQPFYALVNNQVGSRLSNWVPAPDGTTPDPMDMLVKSVRAWQQPGPTGLQLSSPSYLSNVSAGGTVATISSTSFGNSTGATYSILSDPDSVFAIVGNALTLKGANAGTSHQVTLQVADGQGRTWQRLFTLQVLVATPAQPNLLPSQDLSSSAWNKEAVTATSNKLMETTASGSHDVVVSSPVVKTSAQRYRFVGDFTPSLGRTWIQVQVFANASGTTDYGSNANCWFNLTGAAPGYSTGSGNWGGANVVPVVSVLPSGAVRCQFDFTVASETGLVPLIRLANGQDASNYTGDTTKGMKIENLFLYDPAAPASTTAATSYTTTISQASGAVGSPVTMTMTPAP